MTNADHPQVLADQPAPRVFGVGTADREAGQVTQSIRPTFLDHRDEMPIGALCVMLDHALGCRVASLMGADDRMVTSHMHLEVLRAPPLGIERVIGRETSTTMVVGSAFCAADAVAPDGEILVRSTGRYAIIAGGGQAGGRVEPSVPPIESDDGHDAVFGSPVLELFGARVVDVADMVVHTRAVARPEFANERGGMHGGVGAFMTERAADLALRSRVGADHPYRPVEMRVFFARPLVADGGAVDLTTTIGFLGRTTASTTTCLMRPDGKLAVQVDITHLVG